MPTWFTENRRYFAIAGAIIALLAVLVTAAYATAPSDEPKPTASQNVETSDDGATDTTAVDAERQPVTTAAPDTTTTLSDQGHASTPAVQSPTTTAGLPVAVPPTAPPAPAPAPQPSVQTTVDGRVIWVSETTNEPFLHDDGNPVRLLQVTENCCAIPNTSMDHGSSITLLGRCKGGEMTKGNANDYETRDDALEAQYTSDDWFWARHPNGTEGFVAKIWINEAAWGAALPGCP